MSEDSDERLHKARRSVQTATRQAYSALISSNETIINVDPSSIVGQNSDTYPEDDDNNNNDNTRAGMDLGLALFGTSTSYKNQIEQEFHSKLRSVEKELVDIQSSLDNNETTTNGNNNNMSSMTSYGNDDDNSMQHMSSDGNEGKFSSINDATQLQTHINFLQQCSKARKYLEDVDTLSLQTNFATSSIINTSSSSSERKNNNDAIYSPSSICSSPSEFIKFAFNDSPESEEGAVKLSPMVQAAQLIKQTESILDKVMIELKESTQQGKENNANEDKKQSDSQKLIQMQAKMLNELRYQTRQKKMELRHRALTLVDGCVLVEKGGDDDGGGTLIVRGSGTSISTTISASSTKKKTTVAFDVGESPISTSTPTNMMDGAATPPPPSPLSDAYQVLQLLSDPTYGESLDGAMKRLSTKVLSVLAPCFTELKGSQSFNDKKGGVNDKDVGYYKLSQESLKSVRSSGNGSAGSSDRRYDPVSIKGPAVQLQWTLVKLNEEEGSEAATNTLNDNIVTADEINEQALQSVATSTCAPFATYLSTLNFIANFFDFVYQHILLRRSDLAQLLGKHLFGTYPLPNTTSISSGSAVLSGSVLVGSAAHGIEEGDEMPLMTVMVNALKQYCIPNESSPAVWQMLDSMKQCLVKEASAFEEKMGEMHLMGDSTKAKGVVIRPSSSSAAAETSPTGLCILLNNDGAIGSPIGNPNSTLSNLSTLDTTFPLPASDNPTVKTNDHHTIMKILSPLSELANSLGQAYVEGLRAHILTSGRSILLDNDYHNTVQVGTFVPEPSEPGSLLSLDDDPLKTFAFRQCSISTTAQQIMALCRKTLDDATDEKLASSDLVDDALPSMLYRASRELLDLFRAIIPSMHASEVACIPRTAAVLHNDCVYFAHESSLLGESMMRVIRISFMSIFKSQYSLQWYGVILLLLLLYNRCRVQNQIP